MPVLPILHRKISNRNPCDRSLYSIAQPRVSRITMRSTHLLETKGEWKMVDLRLIPTQVPACLPWREVQDLEYWFLHERC